MFDQPPILQYPHYYFRQWRKRNLRVLSYDLASDVVNSYDFPLFDQIISLFGLHQSQPLIDGISEENPGKGFSNDAGDPCIFQGSSCLFPGRATSEIGASKDNVTLLNLIREILVITF